MNGSKIAMHRVLTLWDMLCRCESVMMQQVQFAAAAFYRSPAADISGRGSISAPGTSCNSEPGSGAGRTSSLRTTPRFSHPPTTCSRSARVWRRSASSLSRPSSYRRSCRQLSRSCRKKVWILWLYKPKCLRRKVLSYLLYLKALIVCAGNI